MSFPLSGVPVILPTTDSTSRAIVARYHGDRVTVVVESNDAYGVYIDHGDVLALVQSYGRGEPGALTDADAWEDATTLAERIA